MGIVGIIEINIFTLIHPRLKMTIPNNEGATRMKQITITGMFADIHATIFDLLKSGYQVAYEKRAGAYYTVILTGADHE